VPSKQARQESRKRSVAEGARGVNQLREGQSISQFPIRRLTRTWDTISLSVKAIRYSVHFLALVVAVLVLWFTLDLDLPPWIVNFRVVHFGLMGAFHATCIVVALRDRRVRESSVLFWLLGLFFIALAALWAAVTPITGLFGSVVWIPFIRSLKPGPQNFIFFYITGSVIGALGYWLLVRRFWIRSLRRMDLLKTVTLCVSATLLVEVYGYAVPSGFSLTWPELGDHLFDLFTTITWWFAFSISLYWSETKVAPRPRAIALGTAAVILVLGGTALAQRQFDANVKDDRARLSDLKGIAGALHDDWKYSRDKNLWQPPTALKDMPKVLQGIRLTDPVTGAAYDYRLLSGSKYQLCAVFDRDSSRQAQGLTEKDWSFPKGRHCFAVDASTSPYPFN
jgi:hypothetical protein